jgi:predicted RND superfamily exporter protein
MSAMWNPFFRIWETMILRQRILSLLLSILFIFGLASGMQYLAFSTDYRAFFGKDNPQLIDFEKLQNVFSKDDNVMLVVEAKDGKVFTPKTLKVLQDLTEQSWQIPYSTRVDSITNFQHTEGSEDELIVRDLIEFPEELSAEDLNRAKDIALKEPLLKHRLINADASVSAINITVELPGKKLTEVPEVAKYVRDMKQKVMSENPDIKVYLSGMVMLNNAFAEAGQMDMQNLTPLMFTVILGLIALLTRSLVGTIGTLMVIVLSTLGAMGIAGMMGVKLTPTSITATTVIMTLAVADCVHIVVSIMQGLRQGENKQQAILHGIKSNMLPVFITSLTTAIGFLSLNFSDSPPYHDYGNITAIGVSLAFLLSVTFLPAFLAIFPLKPSQKAESKTTSTWSQYLSGFILKHQKALRWTMPIFILALATGIQRIELNDQFVEYFSEEVEFRRDTDIIMKKLTGIYNLSFALESELDGGVSNPQYMQVVEDFANFLRKEPIVVHVNSLSDTYKRLNKNMHNDDPDKYTLPTDRELAAQYLLLYEMSLPYGLDLNSTIDIDKQSSKLIATLKNSSTVELRSLEDRANAWIRENGKGILKGNASSPSVMFSHISKRNIDSMITGTAISMALITIIMIISLKSLRYGLISLVPNLVPLVMTFGLWGYIEGLVDMGVATIAGLTIGIVVDDTVHFMIKYLRAKRDQNRSPAEAVQYAMGNVGPAIIMTSIVLVAGFMVMSLSTFRMNWTMGVMSAATIGFALLVDILFLPPLLTLLDNKKSNTTDASHEQANSTQAELA